MKKEILILFTILFLLGSATALLKPAIQTKTNFFDSENTTTKTISGFGGKQIIDTDKGGKGYNVALCSGGLNYYYDDYGNHLSYYNGDPLTEQAGTCNANVKKSYLQGTLDMNLSMFINQLDVQNFEGITFPYSWRIGKYVASDFNWNKPENYCFVETYTTRNKTGQPFPLIEAGSLLRYDAVYIYTHLEEYLGNNQWQYLAGTLDDYRMQVQNLNKPLTSIGTDKTNYNLVEGEDTLTITLTIVDDDLKCGKPDWYLNHKLPGEPEYYSGETFQILIDGQPLDSRDQNNGAFGAYIITENQGQLTIDINMSDYLPGEYDLNITVIDIDGYHEMAGTELNPTIEPFIIEEYGTQKETTIHVTKEGGICGDVDDSGSVNVSDAVAIINYVFVGGYEPDPYWTGDVDNSGSVNVSDAVYIINYVFVGGPAPNCGDHSAVNTCKDPTLGMTYKEAINLLFN